MEPAAAPDHAEYLGHVPRLILLSPSYFFRTEAEITNERKGSYLKMALDFSCGNGVGVGVPLASWSSVTLKLLSVVQGQGWTYSAPGQAEMDLAKTKTEKKRLQLLAQVGDILEEGEEINPFKIHPNYLHLSGIYYFYNSLFIVRLGVSA